MYRWYKEAGICYAFLADVTTDDANFVPSLWFSRGWTLQELLAPAEVLFFGSRWIPLGSKTEQGAEIQQRTGIPRQALESFVPDDYCIAERMSWAAARSTTGGKIVLTVSLAFSIYTCRFLTVRVRKHLYGYKKRS